MKTFNYILDGLSFDKVGALYRCLMQVKEIHYFNYNTESQILCLTSSGDQTESLEIAAEIVGFQIRGEMKA